MSVERTNKACQYFPCHKNLEDCTFCYCPFYPCKDNTKGDYVKIKTSRVWDCSECEWIHEKKVVDDIFKIIQRNGKHLL